MMSDTSRLRRLFREPRTRRNRSNDEESAPDKRFKTTKTTILSLNQEILINITSLLTQEDAVSLLYSNKHFERACKIRLYKRIVICEKYQDHYFYEMANQKKISILSGWSNILKFFSMFYFNENGDSTVALNSCVEEISTYNFLDSGRVDPFKVLSNSDLANILNLRQFWIAVLNNFTNLKAFIAPKLPIDKVLLFRGDITTKLTKLSFTFFSDSSLGSSAPSNIYLPNLKSLKLNYSQDSKVPDYPVLGLQVMDIIVNLLTTDGKLQNNMLEELEINGNFGTQDRATEHGLRHRELIKDANMVSTYVSGFKRALSGDYEFRDRLRAPSNGIYSDTEGSESDINSEYGHQEEAGEKDESDEVFNSLTYRLDSHDEYEEGDDPYNLPTLHAVEFLRNDEGKLREERFDTMSFFIQGFVRRGIELTNIKKLSIANMSFSCNDFNNDETLFLKNFHKLFPNFYQKLDTLILRNLHHVYGNIDPNLGPRTEVGSFIKHFSESPDRFDNLKKLEFFSSPDPIQCARIWRVPGDDGDIWDIEFNPFANYLGKLVDFTAKTPLLEELTVVAPVHVHLKHFYRVIYRSPIRNKLKKLTYHEPKIVVELCTKILNAKVFKRFRKFNNLKVVEDYHYGCSKRLVEHFISMTRIDDYGADGSMKNNKDTLFFKEEFLYLFGDDARRFFKICPNLEEFTLYGFTFERNKNIFVY